VLRGAAAGAPVRPPKLPYRSAATRVRDPPPPVARCPAEQRTPACPPGRSGRGRYASARRCGSRPAASRRGPVPWAAAPGGSPGLRQPVVLSEIPHRHLQGNLRRPGWQLARGQHGQRQQRQQRQRHQPGQRHGAQSAAKPGCHLPVAWGGPGLGNAPGQACQGAAAPGWTAQVPGGVSWLSTRITIALATAVSITIRRARQGSTTSRPMVMAFWASRP